MCQNLNILDFMKSKERLWLGRLNNFNVNESMMTNFKGLNSWLTNKMETERSVKDIQRIGK